MYYKKLIFTSFICFITFYTFSNDSISVLTTNYPPFQYEESGKVVGFSTEVVKEILKRAGLKTDITIYPWERAKYELDNKKNTLTYNLTRTPAREELYHWLADITPTTIYLWKAKSNNAVSVKNFSDLNNYTIAVMESTVSHNYLKKKGVDQSNFTHIAYNKSAVQMLINKRADLYPLDEISFAYLIQQYGGNINDYEKVLYLEEISSRSYLVANIDTDIKIINNIRDAWEEIQSDGTYQKLLNNFIKK